MNAQRDRLRMLMVQMLATTGRVDLRQMASLTADDWAVLQQIVRDNRIAPMLHWQHEVRGQGWPVPKDVVVQWLGAYRRAALRVLRVEQTLFRVAELLDAAQIPYAILGGAGLAWTVYPVPNLRTIRHIDLLIAPEDARRGYDVLAAAGFRSNDNDGNVPDDARASSKHLPALVSPVFEINVELHFATTALSALSTHEADDHHPQLLLARRVHERVRDRMVAVLNPTDAVLNIILNTAYDRAFGNGALVSTDIALLIANRPIDWTKFWKMAGQGGWTRGCQLALHLTETAHGALPVGAATLTAARLPEAIVRQAQLLALCKMDAAHEAQIAAFLRRRGIMAQWLNGLKRRLTVRTRTPLKSYVDRAIVVADWLHTAHD